MAVLSFSRNFYNYDVSDILADNLRNRLEYGLLELGAFTNVQFSLPTSGYTNLKSVYDPRHSNYQVYEGLGPSWVWQDDVGTVDGSTPPINASGVWVNSVFYPTVSTSGTYTHKIDFQNGRVIFDSPLISSDSVKCEYSFNDVAIRLTSDPMFLTVANEYLSRFNTLTQLSPSGMASILKEKRVWMPAVFLSTHSHTYQGLQLGGGKIEKVRVIYRVVSDMPFSNSKLSDVITNQVSTHFCIYDANLAPPEYNFDGTVNPSGQTYKELSERSSPHFWTFAYVNTSNGGGLPNSSDVYRSDVTQEVWVDRYLSTY